ncbi:transglutaminase-like domain-containing protein [Patescibacteria group bacterium]|nr:transglutaminase-like domain-containing protein [Patescibacteria group bacterium]
MLRLFGKLSWLILLSLVAIIFPTTIQAQEKNFSVDLDTTYTIANNGDVKVSHHFQITNLNPTLFIKQYGLKLSSSKIDNVVIRDNTGEEISKEVVKNNNQTNIGITFPDQIVGQNKSRDFTITYQNPDVANISGQVLEVIIPQQASDDEFDSQSVQIISPLAFGLPTRANPNNYQTQLNSDGKSILTRFDNLNGNSASLIFGDTQIYEFNIKYSLDNPTNTAKISQIALPPDTPWQKVDYKLLEPTPSVMKTDADGNWIATYRLEPNSATIVNAHILVKVSLTPDSNTPFTRPNQDWLSSQSYWQVGSSNINKLIPEFDTLKEAYDYVVKHLNYDFDNINGEVERLGAEQALKTPDRALCQEFTDLFITFARAKNVPARRLTGYANTQNDLLRPLSFVEDVLHAWPEYYDAEKNTWVSVDPTWEKTSGGVDYFNQFDLNHVVFAINGLSSEQPYPAGSYKLTNQDKSKDIEVKFANQFISAKPDFEFKIENQTLLGFPIPGTTKLFIFNRTGQAFYHQTLSLLPQDGRTKLSVPNDYEINSIMPFEKKEVKINAYADGFFWPRRDTINLNYHDQTTTVAITVVPNELSRLENPVVALGLGAGLVTVALLAGSLLVFVQRRRRPVRR